MFDYQEFNNALYASLSGNQNYCNYAAENERTGNQISNQINRQKYEIMQADIQKFMRRRD